MADDGVLHVLEHAVAQLEQRFAGGRDADAAPDAVKHRLAELLFEQQNLAADGRLRDAQLLAGGRERSGVGDGADDLELPQVHGRRIHALQRMGATAIRCVLHADQGGAGVPRDGFLQISRVHFDPDEADAELRARDGRRAQAQEGIGDGPDPVEAVQPQAHLREAAAGRWPGAADPFRGSEWSRTE